MVELDEYLRFAIDLAKEAGEMITSGQARRFQTMASAQTKTTPTDLVTETDEAVENFIKESIKQRYPSHKFLGEETFAVDKNMELTDSYTWIVDPIDGTSNFVHSLPLVGCSIGLSYQKIPIVGVINMPFLKQLFSARIGGGAYMNESIPLPLNGQPQALETLQQCLIGFEWGGDRREETMSPKIATVKKLVGDEAMGGLLTHGVRTLGCSAAQITAVAAGGLDIYWDNGCYPWDVCAGIVIIQECGGYVTTGHPETFVKGGSSMGDVMMGRRYCFVRAVAPSENETSKEKQERLAGELLQHVTPWKTRSMAYLKED